VDREGGVSALTVRKAISSDAARASEILQEAATWLLSKGIQQWQPEWFNVTWAANQITKGTLYLGIVESVPVATIRLLWEDADIWGQQALDAGYMHSLAVRRANAGIGRHLIAWAAEQVRAAGRSYLRLDCWNGNTALHSYYRSLGFNQVDVIEQRVKNKVWLVSRFQKRV
jgi:ribosomal protein S18 acetylase RimI-like enzyme